MFLFELAPEFGAMLHRSQNNVFHGKLGVEYYFSHAFAKGLRL